MMEQVDPQLIAAAPETAPADDYTPDAREKNGRWQHLVKYCIDLYDRINRSEYRRAKQGEIKKSYEAYEQVEQGTDDPWPGASNIQLPLTTISVDNLEPRIVSGLIGKKPYIKFEIEGEQQQPPDVRLIEDWFNNELEEVVNAEKAGTDIAHTLLLEGTVYPIPRYDQEDRKIRDFATIEDAQQMPELMQGLQPTPQQAVDPMSGQPMMVPGPPALANIGGVIVDQATGEPVVIERLEPLFDGGKIDFCEFNDLFILDDAEDWEKTPVLRKVYLTYAELMRIKAQPPAGYIPENIGTWLCREKTAGRLGEDQQTARQEVVGAEVSTEVIECLECSIRYVYRPEEMTEDKDVQDWTEERVVALIALDKRIILRLALLREINWKNEHLIKRVRLFPERGRAYGTSVAAKCRAIQAGASKTFNMAINIAEIVCIPWFMFSNRAGFKGDIQLSPGKGIPVDDPSQVVFPRFNINPDQMFQYLSIWEGYWERLISIGDLQVGRPASDKTTATEVMAVLQEGNVKHNYQVKTMRNEFLSVFITMYDLYYQHMPLTKTFMNAGQQVPIPRAAMRRPFKFTLTGSTELSNKLIKRKETEDFFNLTVNDQIMNPISIREDLCLDYGRTDTSRYINPQIAQVVQAILQFPEAAALFQQSMAQAQQMAAEAEGGPQQQQPPQG